MTPDTFTLTECYGIGEPDYVVTITVLMLAGALVAICYTLWRIFVTNRTGPGGTTILGLDENSATYTELYDRRIPWQSLFLYASVAIMTFKLGVLAFEAYWYLMGLLPDWLFSIINGD